MRKLQVSSVWKSLGRVSCGSKKSWLFCLQIQWRPLQDGFQLLRPWLGSAIVPHHVLSGLARFARLLVSMFTWRLFHKMYFIYFMNDKTQTTNEVSPLLLCDGRHDSAHESASPETCSTKVYFILSIFPFSFRWSNMVLNYCISSADVIRQDS